MRQRGHSPLLLKGPADIRRPFFCPIVGAALLGDSSRSMALPPASGATYKSPSPRLFVAIVGGRLKLFLGMDKRRFACGLPMTVPKSGAIVD
jgi:hypothetical protein